MLILFLFFPWVVPAVSLPNIHILTNSPLLILLPIRKLSFLVVLVICIKHLLSVIYGTWVVPAVSLPNIQILTNTALSILLPFRKLSFFCRSCHLHKAPINCYFWYLTFPFSEPSKDVPALPM